MRAVRQPSAVGGPRSDTGLGVTSEMTMRLQSDRHDEILRQVSQHGTVSASDLATSMGVSHITIRRDLDQLQADGLVERVRGGARRRRLRGPEPPIVQRQTAQVQDKRAIGLLAVDLIDQGDVVALESGSTALELAYAIAARNWVQLTVLTNSFPIAQVLMPVMNVTLIFLGGVVDPNELGTFGVLTEHAIKGVLIDKLFIGCRGIDPQAGVTSDIGAEREISTARTLVAASNEVVIIADHERFGRKYLVQVIEPQQYRTVVTDRGTPASFIEALRRQGKRVMVAPNANGPVQ